jgi:hypothetical protein
MKTVSVDVGPVWSWSPSFFPCYDPVHSFEVVVQRYEASVKGVGFAADLAAQSVEIFLASARLDC